MTLTFTSELFKYIVFNSPTSELQQALLVSVILENVNTTVT